MRVATLVCIALLVATIAGVSIYACFRQPADIALLFMLAAVLGLPILLLIHTSRARKWRHAFRERTITLFAVLACIYVYALGEELEKAGSLGVAIASWGSASFWCSSVPFSLGALVLAGLVIIALSNGVVAVVRRGNANYVCLFLLLGLSIHHFASSLTRMQQWVTGYNNMKGDLAEAVMPLPSTVASQEFADPQEWLRRRRQRQSADAKVENQSNPVNDNRESHASYARDDPRQLELIKNIALARLNEIRPQMSAYAEAQDKVATLLMADNGHSRLDEAVFRSQLRIGLNALGNAAVNAKTAYEAYMDGLDADIQVSGLSGDFKAHILAGLQGSDAHRSFLALMDVENDLASRFTELLDLRDNSEGQYNYVNGAITFENSDLLETYNGIIASVNGLSKREDELSNALENGMRAFDDLTAEDLLSAK
jgi:hypothetical protein